MYLESVHIENVKLIRDLTLDFRQQGGEIRRWTVIIGKNGRAKTAILQSIALAAASSVHVNDLGKAVVQSFPSLTTGDQTTTCRIQADFRLEAPPQSNAGGKKVRRRELPGIGTQKSDQKVGLRSEVWLKAGYNSFEAKASFDGLSAEDFDPLKDARARGLPYWMVLAYGVSRHLRFAEGIPYVPNPTDLHLERLRSVFTPDAMLRGMGFMDLFEPNKAGLFSKFVQELMKRNEALLPELTDVELRGQGGVTKADDLLKRQRLFQRLPNGRQIKLPATWLSHGYQSSLAWLTDLIGHALIEDHALSERDQKASPDELQGLVLIDELDMHLHPSWQRVFIIALRETFPNLQFIATTHSPLLLSSLRPEEVTILELNEDAQIVARDYHPDPRLMTGSELYDEFFGVGGIFPSELGEWLDDYRFLARNPYRSDEEEASLGEIRKSLLEAGVKLGFEPVMRSKDSA